MAKDNQVAIRINDPTYEAIEEFAQRNDYTKAEAVRRIVEGRLAGEGYLDGIAVADGGIEERLEDTEESIQKEVNRVSTKIETRLDSQQSSQKKLNYSIIAGLLFIAVEVAFGLPAWVTISFGLVLFAGLAYQVVSTYE
jgi:hypothetical protein